ncbi:hypothetical protein DE146DRAFT_764282 [Phaeosphaeria sp. MPI-PUGE-AT-0046c]|nr:hypothetical protein DE146DRAFT_764282 [Phaeosphaeria sp. MPI-PUGE-AT-0046c]
MSTPLPLPDSRSPAIEASSPRAIDLDDNEQPMTLSHSIEARHGAKSVGPTKKLLARMRSEIEELLDEPWRKEFTKTADNLVRLGNKKPKLVHPRRQKLQNIIANHPHVARLYNDYAAKHAESERRLTYRLPVFADLEQQGINKGDNDDKQDESLESRPAPGNSMQTSITKHASGPGKALQQTEEVIDKGTEVAQTNELRSDMQSNGREAGESRAYSSTDMMNIPILPRAEARPVLQRRHVHFAPEVTERQEQPSTTVEPTKTPDAVVHTIPTKDAPRTVVPQGPAPQPVHPMTHTQITPVTNPEAFPVGRIQSVQAQYYPSASIVNIFTHSDTNGEVIRVAADMQDGPVNHFTIHDRHIITALGLREGKVDRIAINEDAFRLHETFTITIPPHQHVKNVNNFVIGELQSARHAFLHWLDHRGCTDPGCPPFAQEVRIIAGQLGRRAHDVWKDIDSYWQLEQGSGGKLYKNNRLEYLGEDVRYDVNIERKEGVPSMWG